MDEHEENFKDIFRYTDVEYTPDGYTDVYRWDDFLVIAGDHVYSAMDTIDSVSPGGEYEGFDPQYAYTCEIVGCGDGWDGSCLNRLDWFEDAVGMDADGLSAGLVANDPNLPAPIGARLPHRGRTGPFLCLYQHDSTCYSR